MFWCCLSPSQKSAEEPSFSELPSSQLKEGDAGNLPLAQNQMKLGKAGRVRKPSPVGAIEQEVLEMGYGLLVLADKKKVAIYSIDNRS